MTRWFVRHSDDGDVLLVARIREEADGTYPEVWMRDTWAAYPQAMSYLFDPLAADEVDEPGAEAAVRTLTNGG